MTSLTRFKYFNKHISQLIRRKLPVIHNGVVRNLNLQEYQSKQLMSENGIYVQKFKVASSLADAEEISKSFKVDEFVIKAQILAGGRGKGTFSSGFKGGVYLTKNSADIPGVVKKMLGYKLVTKQTPKEGVLVNKVMVAEALDISRETYFAILMDRESGGPTIVASPAGGVDIEDVAKNTPHLIHKERIDIFKGLTDGQAESIAKKLNFEGNFTKQAVEQMKKLYELFLKVDACQVEINPFGETKDGRLVCFDAKINFDDNAEFRQQQIFAMEDHTETDPREVQAEKYNLNYIGMDGTIACLVNGAGLAMATMDIIHMYGGNPANFLDVGGTVKEDQVFHAFKILTSDEKVRAVLVNIFGGIVNCAVIANGIVNACKSAQLGLPLIVRLEGTNVDEGKSILANSGLPIQMANDLDEAARKAVDSAFAAV